MIFNILIYLVAAIIVRKRLRITVGLCRAHQAVRGRYVAVAWLLVFGSYTLFFVAFAGLSVNDMDMELALAGLGVLFAAVVAGCLASNQTVRAKKINASVAILKGAGEDFLGYFPEL